MVGTGPLKRSAKAWFFCTLACVFVFIFSQNCGKLEDPVATDVSFQNIDQGSEDSANHDEAAPLDEPEAKMTVQYSEVNEILVANCFFCHNSSSASGGISLDKYDEVLKYVVPGNTAQSRLYQAIDSGVMPPASPLAATEIEKIRTWIDEGAKIAATDVLPDRSQVRVNVRIDRSSFLGINGVLPYTVTSLTQSSGLRILGVKKDHVQPLTTDNIVNFAEFDILIDRTVYPKLIDGAIVRFNVLFAEGMRVGSLQWEITGDLDDCFDVTLTGVIPRLGLVNYDVSGTRRYCVP